MISSARSSAACGTILGPMLQRPLHRGSVLFSHKGDTGSVLGNAPGAEIEIAP
jgi:hypothetical protein